MKVFLNDGEVVCAEGTSVAGLLAQEGIAAVNVAVAVEGCVVPRGRWEERVLEEGARVLVIRAVQGG